MIVACHACPSQYSVPDAKVRGKKVRITCKHCGAHIVVDGMSLLAADLAPASPKPKLKPPAPLQVPSFDAGAGDDLTLIARPKFGETVSVHDEPTVIGQIPREALDFERTFSQRSEPQAEVAKAATVSAAEPPLPRFDSTRPAALPEVPERPEDATKQASPRALSRSEPPMATISTAPVPSIHPSVPPAPPASLPTIMIKDTRDEPTLISRSLSRSLAPGARPLPQRWHVARVALMLLALVLVSFFILKLR